MGRPIDGPRLCCVHCHEVQEYEASVVAVGFERVFSGGSGRSADQRRNGVRLSGWRQSTYLKRVFNSGDALAFVKVNILEIIYNADGSHREIPVATQADGSGRDGLMAQPRTADRAGQAHAGHAFAAHGRT